MTYRNKSTTGDRRLDEISSVKYPENMLSESNARAIYVTAGAGIRIKELL